VEYLHATFGNYVRKRTGQPPEAKTRHHVKIGFDVWDMGITKRRLLEGQTEDADDWKRGHPILFPYILAQGDSSAPTFQIRVPVDDENTLHFWYLTHVRQPDEAPQVPEAIPCVDAPYRHADGRLIVDTVNTQDMMAWVTQGPISDRTTERLGTSDKGIILLRNILLEQMERVKRGEDPIGVIRDPARNEPMIAIQRENKAHYTVGGFVDRDSDLVREFARK
jgi:5,5'-dehydrodivanillate O-demethylase